MVYLKLINLEKDNKNEKENFRIKKLRAPA